MDLNDNVIANMSPEFLEDASAGLIPVSVLKRNTANLTDSELGVVVRLLLNPDSKTWREDNLSKLTEIATEISYDVAYLIKK